MKKKAKKRGSGITRLTDGRYVVRYYRDGTAAGGQRQENLGHITREEAEAVLASRKAQAAAAAAKRKLQRLSGEEVDEPHRALTFAALAAIYLRDHGPSMAANSVARAKAALDRHLLPAFGSMLVKSLDTSHVRSYRQKRLADKASPATVNREWNIMRAILYFGVSERLIRANPIPTKSVKALKATRSRTDFFEPEEWRTFLAAFEDEARWKAHLAKIRSSGVVRFSDRALGVGGRAPDSEASAEYLRRLRATVPFFRALLYTAARIGELAALKWQDVDLRRGLVTLHQQKTNKDKTLPIVAPLRQILAEQRPGVGSALVFTTADGRPLDVRGVQRAFALALKLSGFASRDLSVHSIRHTVASWLTIADVSERRIAEILGHASSSVTSGYAHLAKGALAPTMETLVRIERDGFTNDEIGAAGVQQIG